MRGSAPPTCWSASRRAAARPTRSPPSAPLLGQAAAHPILLDTGPEVVAGSTRMKAGTAQKIALNTLSTAIMIRLGRVHAGLMVDMRLSNDKLRGRAAAIVARLSGTSSEQAAEALSRAGGRIKPAVLVALGATPERAEALLAEAQGSLRPALARIASEI
jgi:N-acetylmuramic acid 6-phosphate etherase